MSEGYRQVIEYCISNSCLEWRLRLAYNIFGQVLMLMNSKYAQYYIVELKVFFLQSTSIFSGIAEPSFHLQNVKL